MICCIYKPHFPFADNPVLPTTIATCLHLHPELQPAPYLPWRFQPWITIHSLTCHSTMTKTQNCTHCSISSNNGMTQSGHPHHRLNINTGGFACSCIKIQRREASCQILEYTTQYLSRHSGLSYITLTGLR